MTSRTLARLARMDAAELSWRGVTAARMMFDRARTSLAPPQWKRTDLLRALAPLGELTAVRTALAKHKLGRCTAGTGASLHERASALRHRSRIEETRCAIASAASFPALSAKRPPALTGILAGQYDLLGYRGLDFTPPDLPNLTDWHLDPCAPAPGPAPVLVGPFRISIQTAADHKIIWELNRHQHWLALGRAFWLTDDRIVPRLRPRAAREPGSTPTHRSSG